MGHHLSKTRYVQGLQCEKQLWLACNKPEERSEYDQATLDIFERGTIVGEMAAGTYPGSVGLFPGGVLIAGGKGYLDRAGAVAETQRAIANGAHTIYEAAFFHDNVYVFADIFTRMARRKNEAGEWELYDQGHWDLYEVKSTGSVHEQHKPDIGVQYWVCSSVGYRPAKAGLVYIAGSQGMCLTHPWEHFGIEDLTGTCQSIQGEVASDVSRFNRMIAGDEPQVARGPHCRKPYTCMFEAYCTRLEEQGQ